MSNERFTLKTRDIVGAALAAVSVSVGVIGSDASGISPSEEKSYSPLDFKPIIEHEELPSQSLATPSGTDMIVEFPLEPVLTLEEKRDIRINEKFLQIMEIAKAHENVFGHRIEDFNIYGKFYLRLAEKYNYVPWELIFVVHEAETGASNGERGFAPDSYYKGAMQLDPNIWPQEFVDKAAKGLEDLADLPQRHEDDWKQLAGGTKILGRNIAVYRNRGLSLDKSVLKALLLYSRDDKALERYQTYLRYKEIFSEADLTITKRILRKAA